MRAAVACVLAAALGAAQAQVPQETPPAAEPPAAPRGAAAQTLERVEISRDREAESRRASTASRIIIGKEEIERYGDSSIAETLRRLPGVTSSGRPGRSGEPRLRGMGGGYTQILVNGERMPPGFSLDTLPPEQVERIEIMRAPTAEHGARAIAGTINIVLREPLARRLNELRLSAAVEQGLASPQVSATRNDAIDSGAYTLTATATHNNWRSAIDERRLAENLAAGAPELDQREVGSSRSQRSSLHANGRMQWRPVAGSTLTLQPFTTVSRTASDSARNLFQAAGPQPPPFAHADGSADSRYTMVRLNGQGEQRFGDDTRFELRGHLNRARWRNDSVRHEFDALGAPSRRIDDDIDSRDNGYSAAGKLTHRTSTAHRLVGGWETETNSRRQMRSTLQDGAPQFDAFGDSFSASSRRLAAFVEGEFNPHRQWSVYTGLRWEQITTRGDDLDSGALANRSDVWTPLAHAVWRSQENARDQIRASLTRSYKSPSLSELIGRPSISILYPLPGANTAASPDRVGNPRLRPELARGLDVAYEKYLGAGGVLSANVFVRRISDLIRTVTEEEDVAWSDVPRWVARPRNVGGATTTGLELEAKFRLDEWRAGAAPFSVSANLALFRSRVDGVPGPNNRIDQQPRATANLGAEYRARGVPLRLGASVNWTPATTIQRTDTQSSTASRKLVVDAFLLWLIDAQTQLRLSASNALPRDYTSSSTIIAAGQRQTNISAGPTHVSAAVRLEMKL